MAAASPRQAPAAEAEALLRALDGQARRPRISACYGLGLLAAGVAMLMLPLAYLGLIAAIAWGLYRHATGEAVALGDRASLFFYVVPLVFGVAMIVFLVKPLLAPRARRRRTRALKPQDQPLLFDFVRKVCRLMGAIEPGRIEASCDTRIHMEAGSLRGAMIGRDLTLRIGLPLVYELDLRQFTGCLAHAFSHGGRGVGMRLWAVIRRVDGFFTRLARERDDWDEALARRAAGRNILARWAAGFTMRLVAISRGALWVFMKAGNLVSSFLSRQMTYDADRRAAAVVGANGVGGGVFIAQLLDIAWRKTLDDVAQAREERRVADDLPALVHTNFGLIGDGMRGHVRESMASQRAGALGMAPAPWSRIRRLEAENEKGFFFDDRPATLLFRDFGALCRDVSMDYYAAAMGPSLAQTAVIPTAELIERRDSVSGSFDALKQYCLGCYLFTRLIGPDPEKLAEPADPEAADADLRRARGYLEAAAGAIRPAVKLYVKGCRQALQGYAIEQQVEAGIHSRGVSKETAHGLVDSGNSMKREAEVQMAPFEDALVRRMTAALRLLESPRVGLENGHRLARQAARLAMAIEGMRNCADLIDDLIRCHQGLRALVANMKGREQDDAMAARVRLVRGEVYRSIEALFMRLKSTPYPFEHPNGQVSISHVAIDIPPAREDLAAIHEKGQATLEALDRLYGRALGALAAMALDVETALGLPPIG